METDATIMLKPLQLNGALLEMKTAETIEVGNVELKRPVQLVIGCVC